MRLLTKILNKLNISNFDVFSLGNSAIVYYFIIFYLMPILALLGVSIKFVPTSSAIPYKALGYATIGLIFFIIGYFNKLPVLISKKLPNSFKRKWDFRRVWWVFGVTLVLGLILKAFRILGGGYQILNIKKSFTQAPFYNLIGTFDWLFYIALAIAFIAYFYFKKTGDRRYKIWRYFAWGTFLLGLFYALPSCSRMSAIVPVIIYLIIRWYIWERNLWHILMVMAMAVVFLFPFGNACRHPKALISYQITSERNQVVSESPASLVLNSGKFAADSFLSRINQSMILSAIINHQLFEYGSSFKEIALVFSPPRFIWKNKPMSANADGNEFGHRIGVLASDDRITGVGPTIVGDWYMNFGLAGIVLGMLLMGMLFRVIYEYLIKRTEVSLSGVMIYSIVWIQIIKGMEDWIAPVYVGLIRIFVILLVIHFLISKKLFLKK